MDKMESAVERMLKLRMDFAGALQSEEYEDAVCKELKPYQERLFHLYLNCYKPLKLKYIEAIEMQKEKIAADPGFSLCTGGLISALQQQLTDDVAGLRKELEAAKKELSSTNNEQKALMKASGINFRALPDEEIFPVGPTGVRMSMDDVIRSLSNPADNSSTEGGNYNDSCSNVVPINSNLDNANGNGGDKSDCGSTLEPNEHGSTVEPNVEIEPCVPFTDLSEYSDPCGPGGVLGLRRSSCPSRAPRIHHRQERRQSLPDVSKRVPPVHPDTLLNQEQFLSSLGLVTYEYIQKSQMEIKKVERRRRTTANPKYTSNGFFELGHLPTKRSRRHESDSESVDESNSKNEPTKATSPSKFPALMCFVCEQRECNLTCENCTTKYHSDCIKLTASKAPVPHRLVICPKCVRPSNPPPAHRAMKPVFPRTPSIMSPSRNKAMLMRKDQVSGGSPSNHLKSTCLNKLNLSPIGGGELAKKSTPVTPLTIPNVHNLSTKLRSGSHTSTTTRTVEVDFEIDYESRVASVNKAHTVATSAPTTSSNMNSVSKVKNIGTRSGGDKPSVVKRGVVDLSPKDFFSLQKKKGRGTKRPFRSGTSKRLKRFKSHSTPDGAKKDSGCQTSSLLVGKGKPLVNNENKWKESRNKSGRGDQGGKVVNGYSGWLSNTGSDSAERNNSTNEAPLDMSSPAANNTKERTNGPKGKKTNGLKSLPMNSFSVKKTMLAMTAAAKSVMSKNGKPTAKVSRPAENSSTTTIMSDPDPSSLNPPPSSNQHQKESDNPLERREKALADKMAKSIQDCISAVIARAGNQNPFYVVEDNQENEVVFRATSRKPKKAPMVVKYQSDKGKKSRLVSKQSKFGGRASSAAGGCSSEDHFDSIQTVTEPTTPASTLPLLSPVESRGSSSACLLPKNSSVSLDDSRSSDSSGQRSEVEEESDVLLSLPNSPTSYFNDSEGVSNTEECSRDVGRNGKFMENMFSLRDTVIDLKTQLSDQRALKNKLLNREEAIKTRIRNLEKFIECFKIAFPEIPLPPNLFPPSLSPSVWNRSKDP